ncbi:ATP-binding protein [Andreprevotia chitinilytica]|uniref:ATP-binding protein n=1 Tax=Andreprevotia chitinilytica TaxID=396808 RepID=UPI00068BA7E9|nr:ATP-binding protein [Andreprevotia chitinilytica]
MTDEGRVGDESEAMLPPDAASSGLSAQRLFAGGGEMGAIMREMDWAQTKLGPVESWPRSLKTMLGVVLGSRFPMLLWWGPDLLHLYNDAYRPILRDKHPASLAAPAAQIWAEVWDVAGPMARSVQEGGPATWTEDLQLFINSGSMLEETYFTFSYSPVPGDDGRVGGLLNTVQETTVKVQSERQIRMLHDLAARAAEAKSKDEAYRIATEVLAANELDIPFVLLYVLNEKADGASRVGAGGWQEEASPAAPTHLSLAEDTSATSWPLAEVIRSGHELVIDDLTARFGPLPTGRWGARPERAILLPLLHAGQATPSAVLVLGISPHRTFDDRYQRFFHATADQVTTIIANAHATEQERQRAEKLAELDRSKTAFFSNISHEFRTPLTLLLGPLEVLLSDPALAPETRERLVQMQRNALRMLRLVNTLLDFSRMDAGRHSARFAPTDLARYTADLASAFRSALEKAGLSFTVNCSSLPAPIYVDRDMWEKIVMNLLSNALKFTFEGGVNVQVAATPGGARLTVKDSGTGIPQAEQSRLFQRFYRVEGARSRTHEGTGIGLALVNELVKLHGGEIHVASDPGKGTEFTITLPGGREHLPPEHVFESADVAAVTRNVAAYLDDALQWLPYETPAVASTTTKSSTRLLVADDNGDLRNFLVSLLAPHYDVQAVADGREALAAIQARKPDLVLSDVMMPNLDGLGLLRALRENPETRTLPVILLSARAGQEASLEGLSAGADDYLAKPFTSQELLARVRTHLSMAQARNELNAELVRANEELKAFSYSVSHDLRAPLLAIDGFSEMLQEQCAEQLDASGQNFLNKIRASAVRMGELIDDLLQLARVASADLVRNPVDVSGLAQVVCEELKRRDPARSVSLVIQNGLAAAADSRLLRVLLENLLGNAWKFTGKTAVPAITVGTEQRDGGAVFFVRDNGAGFDMSYANKLFQPFQRLHQQDEFPGTGIGLATVRRVVERHGGRVWAESSPGHGATFFFSLPAPLPAQP